MADLRPPGSDREGKRGQLLLIAAFIIAVSFVVLALIVNSAIFTENLATRDDVAGSQDALEYRHEVTQNIAEIMREINQNNSVPTAFSQPNVDDIGEQGGLQQSSLGRVVDVEYNGRADGTKIAQDFQREFTNNASGDSSDWVLARDVQRTRGMRLNVTDTTPLASTLLDGFRLRVNDSNDEWEMSIHDSGTGDVIITTNPPNASQRACRRTFDGYLQIDVMRGTAGGEPCHALTRRTDGTPMWFATDVEDDYQISFENPTRINGTYSFIMQGTPVDPVNNYGTPEEGPYIWNAIYSLDASYSYHTTSVGFETTVRVTPAEVPP